MALLPHQTVLFLFLIWSISLPSSVSVASTSDENQETAGIKCGSCPCVNPCEQQQQQLPPPPPPPPPPKPPTIQDCNPNPNTYVAPPPPRFVYVTGLPGDVYQYQTDAYAYYSAAAPNYVKLWLTLLVLVAFGMLELMAWGTRITLL